MVYICARANKDGKQWYNLITENGESKLVLVDVVIKVSRQEDVEVEIPEDGDVLPVINDNNIENEDVYTYINKTDNTIDLADYNGKVLHLSYKEAAEKKVWNRQIVYYIDVDGRLQITILDKNEDYRKYIDSVYGEVISKENIEKSALISALANTNYSISENGVLIPKEDQDYNELNIPPNVTSTAPIKNFKLVHGGKDLIEIRLDKSIESADLTECQRLRKIIFTSERYIMHYIDIKIPETVTLLEGTIPIQDFHDWENLMLEYTDNYGQTRKSFNAEYIENLTLTKSKTGYLPEDILHSSSCLTELTIGGNIKEIRKQDGLYKLNKLNIVDGLKIIGPEAFAVKRYSSINITGGSTVEEIGDKAFDGRENMTIDFSKFTSLKRIGKKAFSNIAFGTLVIPDTVESIGAGAFERVDVLKLPKKLKRSSIRSLLAKQYTDNYNVRPYTRINKVYIHKSNKQFVEKLQAEDWVQDETEIEYWE